MRVSSSPPRLDDTKIWVNGSSQNTSGVFVIFVTYMETVDGLKADESKGDFLSFLCLLFRKCDHLCRLFVILNIFKAQRWAVDEELDRRWCFGRISRFYGNRTNPNCLVELYKPRLVDQTKNQVARPSLVRGSVSYRLNLPRLEFTRHPWLRLPQVNNNSTRARITNIEIRK